MPLLTHSAFPPSSGSSEDEGSSAGVVVRPSFVIGADEEVFTIGADVSAAVAARLGPEGAWLPMAPPDLAERLAELNQGPEFTLRPTTASIRAAIEWACGKPEPPLDTMLFPISQEQAYDLSWTPSSKHGAPLQAARHAHRFLARLMRRIVDCRVVFISLAHAEVCRDAVSGVPINVVPPKPVLRMAPDRFSIEVMTYEEALADLRAIRDLLRTHGRADVRLVLAVSPTPIDRTARGSDLVTANTYDKAMLRCVAEAFAAEHADVDYFPAYELALVEDPAVLLGRSAAADQIMDGLAAQFVAAYGSPEFRSQREVRIGQADPRQLYAMGSGFIEQRAFDDAAKCFERLISDFGDSHDTFGACKLRMRYGSALAGLGRTAEAVEQFKVAAAKPDATVSNLRKCAAFLSGAGESIAANGMLELADAKEATLPPA